MTVGGSTNGRGSHAWCTPWSHIRADRRSPAYCRITFDHPPLNAITATTVVELAELVELIQHDADLNVVVFDSANPDFYLMESGVEHDPVSMDAWLDLLDELSHAPALTIASIRGRVSGAGSEFVLACDMRFASRENAVLRPFEAGAGAVPGDGPTAQLSRLVGRGRALEILLAADELDAPRAAQYGYVNRAIDDEALDEEVDEIAARVARFEHDAIARMKASGDFRPGPTRSRIPAAPSATRGAS